MRIRHAVKGIVQVVHVQAFIQGDRPGMEHDLGVFCAKEETGRIQGLRVKVRKQRIDPFLQSAVCAGIGHLVNLEKAVEPGPGAFALLGQIVMAAEMEADRHVRQHLHDDFRCCPEFGIVAVIIVAVQRQTVGAHKVVPGAVPALVLHRHIVLPDGPPERFLISDGNRMGVLAVLLISDDVCPIQIEIRHRQPSTSDCASRIVSIHRRASFMVSSSASPPRVISISSAPSPNLSCVTLQWMSVHP